MVESRSAVEILTGKSTGKKPLGSLGHRWEHNIRIDFEETGVNMRSWANLTLDRDYWKALLNAELNLQVP